MGCREDRDICVIAANMRYSRPRSSRANTCDIREYSQRSRKKVDIGENNLTKSIKIYHFVDFLRLFFKMHKNYAKFAIFAIFANISPRYSRIRRSRRISKSIFAAPLVTNEFIPFLKDVFFYTFYHELVEKCAGGEFFQNVDTI